NLREQIAERGHLRAVRQYDAECGFRRVFDAIGRLRRTEADKTLYVDTQFKENFASYRFFYIALFLLNCDLRNVLSEFAILFKYRKAAVRKAYHFALKGFILYMRSHPRGEARLKRFREKFRIKLKY